MRRVLTLLFLIAVSACDRVRDPAAPGPEASQASNSAAVLQVSQNPTPDQLVMAQAVPGFGGYFLDESGRPTVYLTDRSRAPVMAQALAAFLAGRGFTAADLRVRQGAYDFAQLDSWYRKARLSVFSVPGTILGDVDEGSNRLRFGVADASAAANVRAALARLGIPSEAAIVEQRAPIRALATLRDRVRPVVGGLQINFAATPPEVRPNPSFLCTLGFNTVRFGVNSFITNSHCTNVEGGEETPTDYYQNARAGLAANFIGTELDDPHWNSQLGLDCPPPLQCRYSDAALVRYATGVPFTLGRIARVNEITTTLADTIHTIAGAFRITREQANPVQGEIAHKVGRTTGWTTGVTSETCVDVLALGTNHIRLCQAQVDALVDGGDSGSPVFRRTGGSNVTLLGVLWGGSVDEADPHFTYSPMSGIEREIGPLRTF